MTFGVSIIALAALAGSIFFARLSIPRVNLFNPWMVSAGFALVFYVLPLLIYGVDPDIYTEAPDLLREQVSAATLWTLLFYTAVFVGQAVGERIRVFQNTFDWRRSEFMEDRTLLTAGSIIYSLAWPARALIISQGVYIQSAAEEVSNVLLVSYAKILEELYIVGFLLIGAAYYK